MALILAVDAKAPLSPREVLVRKLTILANVARVAMSGLGCKVGPDYERPQVDLPNGWAKTSWAGAKANAPDSTWWKAFNDSVLVELIDRSRASNLTLRQAGLRVVAARALRGVAVGQFFPQNQSAVGPGIQQPRERERAAESGRPVVQ